ncbi:DNA methylase [Streptococcus pneumoniae]|nr:DNA methylase [Streptococcus pneumoniae]
MTSQQYQMTLFEESEVWTLSVEDFRAKLSQLQETDEVLKIHEELCSLELLGSHLFSDLNIYSLRMLKDCSITKMELHSRPLSQPWMNWGTGHSRKRGTRRVFPIGRANREFDFEPKIKIVGNTKNPNGTSQGTGSVVYDSNGLVGTLCARDYKEPKQVAIPVLTPDRVNKRQNGRRLKKNGEPMFTLTAQDRHGILIKEATKKGYAEATVGDSVNLSHPNSKTRRGRVGNQIANTLLTGESQGVVEPDFRIRKLTPKECWRLQGFPDWAFDKAQEVNSNSQLYKQVGNSVTVNVISAIAKELS